MGADDGLISIGEAARRVGINKSTLSRQVKGGAIRSHDGKVRLSEVLEDRANNINLGKSQKRTSAGSRPADERLEPQPHGGALKRSAVAEDDDEAEDLVMVDGALLTLSAALRLKENYLAKLRQLEFEVKSGKLVDAARVEARVFELARQERDAMVNWPARAAPLIAAELGIDQVPLALTLEKHVRDFLAERSDLQLRRTD